MLERCFTYAFQVYSFLLVFFMVEMLDSENCNQQIKIELFFDIDLDHELSITHHKVAVRLCDRRQEVGSSLCPSTGRREP